jgi:hypothetical protein
MHADNVHECLVMREQCMLNMLKCKNADAEGAMHADNVQECMQGCVVQRENAC